MGVTVRPATVEDAPALHLLNRDSFGYDYDPHKTRQRLAQVLENTGYRVLVAELEGQVVGYVHGEDYDCTYADHMKNILAIAVEQKRQGQGIGRALLEAIERWAADTGAVGIRLSSGYNRTGAHQFYQRCGYVNRKDQKNFRKLF